MQTKTSNFEILMDMIRESVHECYEDEANTIKIEITEGKEKMKKKNARKKITKHFFQEKKLQN